MDGRRDRETDSAKLFASLYSQKVSLTGLQT